MKKILSYVLEDSTFLRFEKQEFEFRWLKRILFPLPLRINSKDLVLET